MGGSGLQAESGSSPQAWGTQTIPLRVDDEFRLIPTGVGNTSHPAIFPRRRTAHPHRRGEHSSISAAHWSEIGSSPQAWGTRVDIDALVLGDRLIPTGVGNTTPNARNTVPWTAHPHRRGEHFFRFISLPPPNGSSPQAWGTPRNRVGRRQDDRLIPTGVGNTIQLRSSNNIRSAHPHRRGEHPIGTWTGIGSAGSSPQAWGTR